MEMDARDKFDPQDILDEIRENRERRVRRQNRNTGARYQISPEANSLTILLFGIGFLVFVVGVCTGLLTVPHGFVGWIATWVVAVAARSYFGKVVYSGRGDY
jgi:hypothetical protein